MKASPRKANEAWANSEKTLKFFFSLFLANPYITDVKKSEECVEARHQTGAPPPPAQQGEEDQGVDGIHQDDADGDADVVGADPVLGRHFFLCVASLAC